MSRLFLLSAMILFAGCATAGPTVEADAEMDLAEQRTEDTTLARLAASNSHDIADEAALLARERASH